MCTMLCFTQHFFFIFSWKIVIGLCSTILYIESDDDIQTHFHMYILHSQRSDMILGIYSPTNLRLYNISISGQKIVCLCGAFMTVIV